MPHMWQNLSRGGHTSQEPQHWRTLQVHYLHTQKPQHGKGEHDTAQQQGRGHSQPDYRTYTTPHACPTPGQPHQTSTQPSM
eukprot:2303226-Prorocentrum_lima.AAC.1